MLRKIITAVTIGFISFSFVWVLSFQSKLLDGVDRALTDFYFYVREPDIKESNPYVHRQTQLLGFDLLSLNGIGKFPWKRNVYAKYLDNIQKYSPEAVLIDVLFEQEDKVPTYIENQLDSSPNVLSKVNAVYQNMDNELTKTLKKYDNVYLDIAIGDNSLKTGSYSDQFKAKLSISENRMLEYSQPANQDVQALDLPMVPLIPGFVENAHPVVVNFGSETDGKVRYAPLYWTYQYLDGSKRNLFTVALTLLQKYYRVDRDNVIIKPTTEKESGKVILANAKNPIIDRRTGQPKVIRRSFKELSKKVINPQHPSTYNYNENLFALLVNEITLSGGGEGRAPYYPLHVLIRKDKSLEILDGWEVLNSTKKSGATQINVILYKLEDVEIDTPRGNDFAINFAGEEKKINNEDGTVHYSIPAESFLKGYNLPPLPNLPIVDIDGKYVNTENYREAETWFFNHVLSKHDEAIEIAERSLPEDQFTDSGIITYFNQFPEVGKYFFYATFINQFGIQPGQLSSTKELYTEFAEQFSLDPAYFLNESTPVMALLEAYRENFELFYNKYIFSGAFADGLGGIGDIKNTPYGEMFGINVIINAFNTIVTKNQIVRSEDNGYFDLLALSLCAIVFAIAYGVLNIRISSYLFIASFFSTFIMAFFMFWLENYVVRITPLITINIVVFMSSIIYKLLTEEKDKKFLKATFASYLSPELIDDMYETKTMPTLGGEARQISAYFTDIQGFSTFSEKLTAPQLVELLNEYLSAMTDILLGDKGTLDKYEGDAIIAFFGAPMHLSDHTIRACNAAVDMQNKLIELREIWKAEKQGSDEPNRNTKNLPSEEWSPGDKWPKIVHEMKMRIGVNTGEIVVGNMGSAVRMNYTMMGDSVNLAARLEAAAKQYGVYTLLSQYTLDYEFISEDGQRYRTKDFIEVRFIDNIAVVGKSEPVKVYELCAMKGGLTDQEKDLFKVFNEGVDLYLKMDWDKAIVKFQEAIPLERVPDGKTTPSEIYIERCERYKENPPVADGETWDGVYRLTEK